MTTTQPMIHSLLPPGGFSNLVGHYVAALDIGSAYTAEAARAASDPAAACEVLARIGQLESAWVHQAIGAVPTPPEPVPTPPEPGPTPPEPGPTPPEPGPTPPEPGPTPPEPEGQDVEAWLGWLDAVRTVTIMVLRPLQDRDLERLITVSVEADASPSTSPRTLKRVLAELLYLQGAAATF